MNKKRLAINIGAGMISFLINFIISFFLSPYIIKTLGKEAHGFLNLGNQFVSYATILTSALNSMASRFIAIEIHRKDNEKRDQYFSSVIISNIVIALVLLVPCCLVVVFLQDIISVPFNLLSDVKMLWAIIFANFLINLVANAYNVTTLATNRLYLNSIRTIESALIRALLLCIMFAIFKPSVWYMGFATIVCSAYTISFNFYYTRKFLPDMRFSKKHFSFVRVKELLSEGVWNSFSQLASVLNNGLDLLISNLFISASAMGTMSIAKLLPTYFVQVLPMFSNSFQPELIKNYAEGDKHLLLKNVEFGRKIMSLISALFVGLLVVNGDIFYRLWVPGEDSWQIQSVAIVSLVVYIFVGSLTTVADVIVIAHKQKHVAISYFLAGVLNVALVFPMLQLVENGTIALSGIDIETLKLIIIAGTSSIIAIVRNLIFTPLYASKCFNIKWYHFYPTLIRGILGTGAVMIVAFVTRRIINIDSWILFFVTSALIAIIGAALNIFILFDKEQRKQLYCKVKDKFAKKNGGNA